MKWNLRLAAANRGIWKASELQRMLAEHGLTISAGKMSGLWSGTPASIKLDDLDVICTVLGCGIGELLIPEPAKVQPKKETVRISLPPKPTATIRLPTMPAATPGAGPAPAPAASFTRKYCPGTSMHGPLGHSGVTNHVVPFAEAYCTDHPATLTAEDPRLKSSIKSFLKVAPVLPPPP